MNTTRLHSLLFIVCAAFALAIFPHTSAAQAGAATKKRPSGNLDIRIGGATEVARVAGRTAAQMQGDAAAANAVIGRGIAALRAKVPGAEASLSAVTGAVEVVSGAGTLTDAVPGVTASDVVRGFVRENRALYGLSDADVAARRE